MIKLVKKDKSKGIWVGDMKDGDIGVVVNWGCDYYLHTIIQRYDNRLITIGADCVWSNCVCLPKNCRARLLEKGETLIVT